jgi:hypothetical protein
MMLLGDMPHKKGGFQKWLIRSVMIASCVVHVQKVVPQALSQKVMASSRSTLTLA